VVVGVEQEWAARSLESILGPHGYAVVRAYSGVQALDLAEVAAPDVVIVESRLPDLDGLEVCRRLRREQRIAPQVPLIVMTSAAAPRDFLRECYEAGAWSVWEQPVDGELLLLRLDSWVAAKRASDDAERDRIIEQDAGLYTYRALAHRADELVADAARRRTPLTCLAITVSGDDGSESLAAPVATAVARTLASVARGSDIVARLAPTEFAVLAPDTPVEGAIRLAERFRARLADISGAGELRAGIAPMADSDAAGRTGGELVVRAVTALRYATYGPDPGRTVRRFDEVPAGFL
jgi:PleD family two-component response regulator